MRTEVLVFHPNLAGSRVNAALARAARTAHDVRVRDMYILYPESHVDVATEHEVLAAADRIVLQFPMYWYSSPALLKQYLDDVLTYGWAYGSNGTALRGKDLLIAVSPGADAGKYTHEAEVGFTVDELLRPFHATSNLIHTNYLAPFITAGAMSISTQALATQCERYIHALTT